MTHPEGIHMLAQRKHEANLQKAEHYRPFVGHRQSRGARLAQRALSGMIACFRDGAHMGWTRLGSGLIRLGRRPRAWAPLSRMMDLGDLSLQRRGFHGPNGER